MRQSLHAFIFFPEALLQFFIPLECQFPDDKLSIFNAVLLAQMQSGVRLDTMFQLFLFGCEISFLVTHLDLIVKSRHSLLLFVVFRMECLRQLLVFLIQGFGSRFVQLPCLFHPAVIRVAQFFLLFQFGFMDLVPLFIQTLDQQLVFGRDFRIL